MLFQTCGNNAMLVASSKESWAPFMRDLKDELASLRIERDTPRRGRWRWLVVLLLLAIVAAGGLYFVRARPAFGAVEVQTVQPSVQSGTGPMAGTPILTASGYLVARRQSVVSSKIQGRISRLLVEEGSVVKTGDVLATLENEDYAAGIAKAKADINYARVDLAEAQRQQRLQEGLFREKVVSQDALDASKARVIDDVVDLAVIAQANRDHAVEPDVRAVGNFDGPAQHHAAIPEDAVDSEPPGFVASHILRHFVRSPSIRSRRACVARLVRRIVGNLGLVKVYAPTVTVPEGLEFLVMFDEQAVDGDMVSIHTQPVRPGIALPAPPLAMVRPPDPRVIHNRVVAVDPQVDRSEEHTSELQSLRHLVCRLLLEKNKKR